MEEQQLANLNEAQKDAVLQSEGPLLVLAGAGTGKTKVLTSRIIHIINSYLASPLQILAVTFTNKAAAEMKKRIGEIIGDQVNNLWIGTFHGIAAKITRRHAEIVGLKNDFIIIDQDDQLRLFKQIIGDFNIDTKQFPAKNYLNKVSRMKDFGTAQSLQNQSGEGDSGLPKFKEVFTIYQNRLKAMNAADFGDLLAYNLEIFDKSPETLAYYQDKFHYILVDEYQDTNNVQYKWLLKLADKYKNICAVGDDDQSIYSWRGANIANILRFEKDFANAKVVRLEQNYRSTGSILKAADSVIANNKERHGKTLWTEAGEGEPVKVFAFVDDRSEAAKVTDIVSNYYRQNKYKLSQAAILVRAGYQTRAFEEAFIRASLPYRIIGGMKFYERMEVKDAICYLRAVANPADDLALSRIINVPKRGVGDTTVKSLYQKGKNENMSLSQAIYASIANDELKGKAKEALKSLAEQLERWRIALQNTSLPETAKLILAESGYIQMWQSENTLESQGRIENIDEFINSLAEFSNITEFLEYVSLVEAKEDNLGQDAVSVMTVHAAKGLEFPLVFIPGLEDGVFPSGRSVEERGGLEEERRLLYVAITRARQELIMCYAQTRYVFGDYQSSMPSRFISELPKNVEVVMDQSGYSGAGGFSSQNSYGGGYSQDANRAGQGATRTVQGGGGYSQYSRNTAAPQAHRGAGLLQQVAQPKIYSKSQTEAFAQKYSVQSKLAGQNVAKSSNFSSGADSSDPLFGKRVFHQKFGYGKVVQIEGSKLGINFEKSGHKTVMKDFVSQTS